MRRFLSPGWLVAHVVILAAAAVMVRLGVWQLDRLADVRAVNAVMVARMEAPPLALDADALLRLDPETAEFRRARVTGTFADDQEVLWRNRARRGVNGLHVLTPLVVGPGTAVLVDRGWVPAALDQPGDERFAPPTGSVTVEGVLRRSVDQPGFGARDPEEGELERVFHPDLGRLGRQVDAQLAPLWLQAAVEDDPATLPRATTLPTPDEGNHLSYAVQWFSFATIAVVGYAAFLRSRLREQEAGVTVVEHPAPRTGS